MSKILVVEDEQDIAELLEFNLTRSGFDVTCKADGNSGLEAALSGNYDAVVLDLMLPERDGLSVLMNLRKDPRTEKLPILILSARGQTEDKIAGLSYGADDFMSKPFSPKELTLRIQGLIKRSVSKADSLIIEIGALRIDKSKSQCYLAGELTDLTQKEYSLLICMCDRAGGIITRQELLKEVWGYKDDLKSRTLDTHMKRLRQKLGDHASLIHTIRNVGYKISADS